MSEADELELPSGWTLTPVGDLLKFKNGLNKGKEYFGYGTPIVNYMDVFRHAGLRRADVHGLVDVTNSEKQAFSARKGDVLLTRTSETPEEVGISTVLLEDIEDAVFSGFVLRGRPVNDRLTPEFAQYCFESRFVRGQIISSATYTTRALTNGRILSNVKLPLPDDPDEQQAIAAALSDADGVVVGLERVIAKKRLIKQGAMQDLLTARRRLPGFSGEWEVKKLGELVTIIMGQSPSSTAYNSAGDGLPLIQGNADIKDRKAITRVFTRQVTKLGRAGDYLMTVRAPVGEIATTDMDVCLGRGVCALRTDQRIVYHIMVSKEPEWAKLSKGSTFDSVNGAEIRAFEVLFPADTAERHAVAQVLDDMDAEIQTLEARLAKARAVKEGMMQNLLTGRVRLV